MVPVGVNAPTDPEDGTESEKTNTFIPTLKILYNFISCSNRWPESIRNLHPLNYVFNRFLQTITQKNILWYKTLLEFQNKQRNTRLPEQDVGEEVYLGVPKVEEAGRSGAYKQIQYDEH